MQDPKNRQKFAIWAPSTILSGCIFATKALSTIGKKLVKQQYLLHMSSQHGELRPTNGWDRLASLGTPANFNGFHVLRSLLLTGGEPNFARCLAISWAGTLYIRFWRLLRLMEFRPVQNSLYVQVLLSPIFERHCTTLVQWASAKLCSVEERAPPIFGRAANAITLVIGPHSSYLYFRVNYVSYFLFVPELCL